MKPIHEQYDSDGGKGDDVNVPLRTPLFGSLLRQGALLCKEGRQSRCSLFGTFRQNSSVASNLVVYERYTDF